MDKYQTVQVDKNTTTFIRLNRLEVHNVMNELMISELTDSFNKIAADDTVRLIVLRGNGKSFCAGADLNYMKSIAEHGYDENYEDGKRLANLFKTIYLCPIPTIAVVHGVAFGGANGLLAACDIVLAEENTVFAFSEVKIGIAPATISPFVIKRIGEFNARDLMLSGRRIKGPEAEKTGLVNSSLPADKLEEKLLDYIREFNGSAPKAVAATKEIINTIVTANMPMDPEIDYTASQIAKLRAAEEGQEGMAAFLEKRKPKWKL